jgi:hypothetical protein
MKKLMDYRIRAICAVHASWKVHADVNYRWCLMGDTRDYPPEAAGSAIGS